MSGYDHWKTTEPDPWEFEQPPVEDDEPDTDEEEQMMATYTDWAQRQLDIATGEELDRVTARLVARGVCPHCGGSGRIFWGVAGDKALRTRPCERCQ